MWGLYLMILNICSHQFIRTQPGNFSQVIYSVGGVVCFLVKACGSIWVIRTQQKATGGLAS